ncbi:MAG: hypothetical protein ABI634_05635 [Acidobacteriota bacterium]
MVRTFVFDDGQTWRMELMRVMRERHDTISMDAKFWTDAAPDQRVIGQIAPRGLALSDAELAEALRRALRHLTEDVARDA